MSFLTYFFLFFSGRGSEDDMKQWTGLLLLFSAGTFLYVSTVHMLPEIYQEEEVNDIESPMVTTSMDERRASELAEGTPSKSRAPSHSGGHSHKKKILSRTQIGALVVGIFTPLLLSFGHHHHQ
jgi:hypothetical protein